jgi:phenylpropionate dioxygenase-like ring-hydroxylating dioxygenase large terminal subunit
MTRTEEQSLPAWIYGDRDFFDAERRHLFARAWHVVCHVNDIPESGDYHTLDILGERFLSLRGADGTVRSFHNVCRHRASRLADGDRGCARSRPGRVSRRSTNPGTA